MRKVLGKLMSDKGYEKMIACISKLNESRQEIYLATMDTSTTLHINELALDKEDLLKNDCITDLKEGDTVLVAKINDEQYVIMERVKRL